MPRFNVQHPVTKQWRCFSTIVDDYVTDWMDEESYQKWRLEEYGKFAGKIRDANLMDYEEAEQHIVDRRWKERKGDMMDEEIRQALTEVREMKKMCGNINMKLTNIVTQRGQDWKKKLEAEYQRGLNDAWEAARKIVCDDELDWNTLLHIFNRGNFDGIFGDFSPSEAIDKLKSYKEKQKADDEIKVGDEVIYNGTTKCIVVRPEDDERYASLIDSDGAHYSVDRRECKKTGRHFDIESILEDMRHD